MNALGTKQMPVLIQPASASDHQLDELVQTCLSDPICAKLLHFLSDKPSTLMTLPDITACLGCGEQETHTGLKMLDRSGLLRKLSVGGLTFFGLSDDPQSRRLTERFRSWCEEQRRRWRTVQGLVACA